MRVSSIELQQITFTPCGLRDRHPLCCARPTFLLFFHNDCKNKRLLLTSSDQKPSTTNCHLVLTVSCAVSVVQCDVCKLSMPFGIECTSRSLGLLLTHYGVMPASSVLSHALIRSSSSSSPYSLSISSSLFHSSLKA